MMRAPWSRAHLVVGPGEVAPRSLVGGKAFRLQELARHGLPVPPWVVLTTTATDLLLAPMRREIAFLAACVDRGRLAAAAAPAGRVLAFIRRAAWPGAAQVALTRGVRGLDGAGGFAVRSSAVGEDGSADSYAGIFESRLGVPPDALGAAVRECLAATFAERVMRYRRERGLRGAWPRLAVVIQEMVPARAAGVAFTADPRTGAPRQIVVAGYGCGAGVVGDQVPTDCYERTPPDGRWIRAIRAKDRAMVPDGAGGTALRDVAPGKRERPALSDGDLTVLAALLDRVDAAFGGAQDVEWALAEDGSIHLLQARPIGGVLGDLAIWDDSNIGESYPGITLPLTYSLVRRTYERLFARALAEIGVPAPALAALAPELRHLVGIVRGHLYMNLLAYYRLFAAAPGLEWTVAKWEAALGIRDAPDPAVRPAGSGAGIRHAAAAVRVWWRLLRRLSQIDGEVARFEAGVDEMLRRLDEGGLSRWPGDRLVRVYEALMGEHLDAWTVLIFNDLFAFLFSDGLARLCGGTRREDVSDLHQRLLAGLGGAASIGPLHALRTLAAEARRSPLVAPLVWSTTPAALAWERLGATADAAAFLRYAAEFRIRYGDRAVEELKLETVTVAEEPWRLLELLRSLGDGVGPHGDGDDAETMRLAAERVFQSRWTHQPLRRWAAMWVLRRSRRLLASRERLSFARARAYGLIRRLVRAMGSALVREGALADARDIGFATFEDLEAHARGGLPGAALGNLVGDRKKAYGAYDPDQHPHRIVSRGSVYRAAVSASAPGPKGAGTLSGIPCSPGRARGPAVVVRNGAAPEAVRGHILVARVTEPGWVFLLSAARGVVVERGSLLSHAAIIGRELGVPTIVGATGALAAIRDGDVVEMDGSTGVIQVLEPGDTALTRGAPAGQ